MCAHNQRRKCLSLISHFNRIPFLIFKNIIYIQCIHLVKFFAAFALLCAHIQTLTVTSPQKELKCLALSVSKICHIWTSTMHAYGMGLRWCFIFDALSKRNILFRCGFFFVLFCFTCQIDITSSAIITFNKVMERLNWSLTLTEYMHNVYARITELLNDKEYAKFLKEERAEEEEEEKEQK